MEYCLPVSSAFTSPRISINPQAALALCWSSRQEVNCTTRFTNCHISAVIPRSTLPVSASSALITQTDCWLLFHKTCSLLLVFKRQDWLCARAGGEMWKTAVFFFQNDSIDVYNILKRCISASFRNTKISIISFDNKRFDSKCFCLHLWVSVCKSLQSWKTQRSGINRVYFTSEFLAKARIKLHCLQPRAHKHEPAIWTPTILCASPGDGFYGDRKHNGERWRRRTRCVMLFHAAETTAWTQVSWALESRWILTGKLKGW